MLGRFRGELTLLDGRGGGEGGGSYGGGAGYGGEDRGYEPAGAGSGARGGAARTDPSGPPPDFDDEIPF